MPEQPPDFRSLILALNKNGVRFVVVGGLAMVYHGTDYATVDADFAVATNAETTEGLIRALAPFRPRPFNQPESSDFPWDARSIFGAVVSLITDVGELDLMRILPGVDSFEGLWQRSLTRTVFGVEIRLASIEDLIAMKTVANRPKDRLHIQELEALAKLEREESG
jgi:hypothetical protein